MFLKHLWNENFANIPCISLRTRLCWPSCGEFSDLHSIFRLRALRYCIPVGIHLNLIRGTWPRISQSQCSFCWVKVSLYNNIAWSLAWRFANWRNYCYYGSQLKQGEKTKTENGSQQIIFILYIITVYTYSLMSTGFFYSVLKQLIGIKVNRIAHIVLHLKA